MTESGGWFSTPRFLWVRLSGWFNGPEKCLLQAVHPFEVLAGHILDQIDGCLQNILHLFTELAALTL